MSIGKVFYFFIKDPFKKTVFRHYKKDAGSLQLETSLKEDLALIEIFTENIFLLLLMRIETETKLSWIAKALILIV